MLGFKMNVDDNGTKSYSFNFPQLNGVGASIHKNAALATAGLAAFGGPGVHGSNRTSIAAISAGYAAMIHVTQVMQQGHNQPLPTPDASGKE